MQSASCALCSAVLSALRGLCCASLVSWRWPCSASLRVVKTSVRFADRRGSPGVKTRRSSRRGARASRPRQAPLAGTKADAVRRDRAWVRTLAAYESSCGNQSIRCMPPPDTVSSRARSPRLRPMLKLVVLSVCVALTSAFMPTAAPFSRAVAASPACSDIVMIRAPPAAAEPGCVSQQRVHRQ